MPPAMQRKDAGVVERAALEMRCTGNCTGGSNPSLSAKADPRRKVRVLTNKSNCKFTCELLLFVKALPRGGVVGFAELPPAGINERSEVNPRFSGTPSAEGPGDRPRSRSVNGATASLLASCSCLLRHFPEEG